MRQRFTLTTSLLCLVAAPVSADVDTLDLEKRTHDLEKRQNASFTVHDGDNSADPNTLTSRMPLQCISGCFAPGGWYQSCDMRGIFQDPCPWLCGARNYTQWTQCLNCVIANGEQDVNQTYIQHVLDRTNGFCSGAVESFTASVTSITASPTTTGPFTETFSSSGTPTFPTWTGLSGLVDPNFYGSVTAAVRPVQGSGQPMSGDPDGSVVVSVKGIGYITGAAPSSTAGGSAGASGGATRSPMSGDEGSPNGVRASGASGAATTSGAAGYRLNTGEVGKNGIFGVLAAMILARL